MDAAQLAEELSPQAGASWPRGSPAVLPKTSLGDQDRMGGQQFAENSVPEKSSGRPAPVQAG